MPSKLANFSVLRHAGVTVLAISLLLPLGCGLNSRSNAGADPGQSGGSGLPGEGVVPVPTAFHALTGCMNPNTGTSNGDWGVGTDPVYTNPWSVLIGEPIYTSNSIFWVSRETSPGQSILLTGAFTDATKTARVAFIPSGTSNWQSVVKASSTIVPTKQQSTTGLSFTIPSSFPVGVYGFEIDDPSAPATMGIANVPSLDWAVGVPGTTGTSEALEHQVYDCGVEPGGTLRVFGKNFTASNQVLIQSSDGVAYSLKPSRHDTNSIALPIPAEIAPGKYNIWVGSLPWDSTSSPAAQITVYPAQSWRVLDVVCSGLVGDGVTDNTDNLQKCLDTYAPLPGSPEIAHIEIPAGTFVMTGGVTGHPFEVVIGVSPSSTNFVGHPKNSVPKAWFNVPNHFGLANISLRAPANPNLLLSSGTTTGNPLNSGHLFFSNLDFASTSDRSGGAESMFAVAGPDVQVYKCSFLSGSNQVFDLNFGDGGIVSGNEIIVNNWTGLGISDSQNVIFENNRTSSQNQLDQGNLHHSGGSGLSVSRGNSQYGQSALSRDIYIGYNTFQHMGSKDQQVITNDGDGGAYFGPVASSTTSTVTLAADPAWNWMGTTNPQAAIMAIISGTGVGQYSFLESYSGRTINLVNPWKVPPDSTSIVVISQFEFNITIAHNTITNTLGASIVFGDVLESLVEDNVMTNSGFGILLSAYGPYGGPAAYGPVINNEILRNTISKGEGNLIYPSINTNIAGIGIQDLPGCLESGLLIRGNVVTSIDTIYNTDGLNGVSANLIEQNEANWDPTFPTPGFLIQDNSAPPI